MVKIFHENKNPTERRREEEKKEEKEEEKEEEKKEEEKEEKGKLDVDLKITDSEEQGRKSSEDKVDGSRARQEEEESSAQPTTTKAPTGVSQADVQEREEEVGHVNDGKREDLEKEEEEKEEEEEERKDVDSKEDSGREDIAENLLDDEEVGNRTQTLEELKEFIRREYIKETKRLEKKEQGELTKKIPNLFKMRRRPHNPSFLHRYWKQRLERGPKNILEEAIFR